MELPESAGGSMMVHLIGSPKGQAELAKHGMTTYDLATAIRHFQIAEGVRVGTLIGVNAEGFFGAKREGWRPDQPDAFSELIHIDIKKLGKIGMVGHRITGDRSRRVRGIGWEYVHVCVDDASRIAFVQVKPDERKHSAVAFLRAAVAYYASLGVTVERVMTDNGSCYRSHAFRRACKRLGLQHVRTKPYTPKTNGKAERFIQTSLREWAYACAYQNSASRTAQLPIWLHRYNWHRPHGSLKAKTPISVLGLTENNVLRLHT
jgi:hypothetical protein